MSNTKKRGRNFNTDDDSAAKKRRQINVDVDVDPTDLKEKFFEYTGTIEKNELNDNLQFALHRSGTMKQTEFFVQTMEIEKYKNSIKKDYIIEAKSDVLNVYKQHLFNQLYLKNYDSLIKQIHE